MPPQSGEYLKPNIDNDGNGRAALRTVDIFCGGGGSGSGAKLAGAEIVGAVDRLDLATQTYKDNHPGATVLSQPLEDLTDDFIRSSFGKVDLLLASPECTNHTPAKGAAKRSEKSRETAFQVTRLAGILEPKWIVVENVIQMKLWRRYRTWLEGLNALGYTHREQILNSSDFGVPQSRRRLFIILAKGQTPPEVVGNGSDEGPSISAVLNMNGRYPFSLLAKKGRAEDTLARAKRAITSLKKNRLHHRPFLLVYYGSDGAGGWQEISRPLRTITTVDRFALVKWEGGRYWMRMLQVDELKAAMGFEDDYKLNYGNRRERIALLGNGVCPPVMTKIVKTIIQADHDG